MTKTEVAAIRSRAFHFLSCEVAATAGLTLQNLQQFCASQFFPTDDQLRRLANRMSLSTTPVVPGGGSTC